MNSQIMDESPTASIAVVSGIIFIGFTSLPSPIMNLGASCVIKTQTTYTLPDKILNKSHCITKKTTSSHEESISISSHNELSEKLVLCAKHNPILGAQIRRCVHKDCVNGNLVGGWNSLSINRIGVNQTKPPGRYRSLKLNSNSTFQHGQLNPKK